MGPVLPMLPLSPLSSLRVRACAGAEVMGFSRPIGNMRIGGGGR